MGWIKRLAKLALVIVLAGLLGVSAWLYAAPPELLRVASGYAAKIVCSNVFIAGRDAQQVLADDVQAPGHPLLKYMKLDVDTAQRTVTTSLPVGIAKRVALYRPGYGCTLLGDDGAMPPAVPVAEVPSKTPEAGALWPEGEAVTLNGRLQAVIEQEELAGPNARAIVVVKDGRIVAERYGTGFNAAMPLLGWSMTKTVNAMVIGALLGEGRLGLDDSQLLPAWQNDSRSSIRLRDLLAMEDGLTFNEDYGTVDDVTRMLFLEPDMARYGASLPADQPPAKVFNYSTGTAILLSRIWMNRMGDNAAAISFPRQAIFAPLGMKTATLELDASNTFVGGSYMYASARDWARLGLMLAQGGMWEGTRLLPEGFVEDMGVPNATSDGRYSKLQTWLPKNMKLDLPAGSFQLKGHDGQSMTVIPAKGIVILRMGLTPSKLRYTPQKLIQAVMNELG
ncbi:serine hydrolase domain-containing protein [Rhizobium helianthi]|uniref:Serine hydrolase domain-containing protein n=1 Tax=Rhizobium helianthi TaxID=1132695 RepID=A0ABW4M6E2_9HYPH